jgi:hypothetical protein
MELAEEEKPNLTSPGAREDFVELVEAGQALKCLKLACQERNVYSLMIGCDPLYDPLRTDQRFNRLLQRMKLGG